MSHQNVFFWMGVFLVFSSGGFLASGRPLMGMLDLMLGILNILFHRGNLNDQK